MAKNNWKMGKGKRGKIGRFLWIVLLVVLLCVYLVFAQRPFMTSFNSQKYSFNDGSCRQEVRLDTQDFGYNTETEATVSSTSWTNYVIDPIEIAVFRSESGTLYEPAHFDDAVQIGEKLGHGGSITIDKGFYHFSGPFDAGCSPN